MTTYYSEFQKVLLSVDCIIFGFDNNKLKILIGKRNMDPGRGEWSLYGGFVRNDESLDEAAHRTLRELTGLRNIFMRQVGAFGNLDRDPGERVVSVAYYALINVKDYSERQRKHHGVEWINIEDIPQSCQLIQGSCSSIVYTLVCGYEASVEAPFATTWIHLPLANQYL